MKISRGLVSRLGAIVCATAIVFVCPLIAYKGSRDSISLAAGISSCFALFCFLLWYVESLLTGKKVILPKLPRQGGGFDWGMHYFRAFAILAIMACHYAAGHLYEMTNKVFFTTSTIFFLFISGYLCQFLHTKKKDSAWNYYRKKLMNVICPFVFFSILFALLKGTFHFNMQFFKAIVLGRVQGQYWYIPFVSFLFLFSPRICNMKNRPLVILTCITAFFLIMFPLRPGKFTITWPRFFYFYTYFTVFYVIGFLYCRYKERIDVYLKQYVILLTIGALLGYLIIWNPPILQLETAGSGLLICVQRFLTMACIIVLLDKIKNKKIWILDQIAKYSFTLYFIHFAVFIQFEFIRTVALSYLSFLPLFLTETLLFIAYVVMMLLISIIFKTAFGKYSRMLIGS